MKGLVYIYIYNSSKDLKVSHVRRALTEHFAADCIAIVVLYFLKGRNVSCGDEQDSSGTDLLKLVELVLEIALGAVRACPVDEAADGSHVWMTRTHVLVRVQVKTPVTRHLNI